MSIFPGLQSYLIIGDESHVDNTSKFKKCLIYVNKDLLWYCYAAWEMESVIEIHATTDQYKYYTVRMKTGRNGLEIKKFMVFVEATRPQESLNSNRRENG